MSESVSEENDRRSSRKRAALFCLLLMFALFALPGAVGGMDAAPLPADSPGALTAWTLDSAGEQDVQALPRDLHRACRTISTVKWKPRPPLPPNPARNAAVIAPPSRADSISAVRRMVSAEIPTSADILADSLPVRAGPAAPPRTSSLPIRP